MEPTITMSAHSQMVKRSVLFSVHITRLVPHGMAHLLRLDLRRSRSRSSLVGLNLDCRRSPYVSREIVDQSVYYTPGWIESIEDLQLLLQALILSTLCLQLVKRVSEELRCDMKGNYRILTGHL